MIEENGNGDKVVPKETKKVWEEKGMNRSGGNLCIIASLSSDNGSKFCRGSQRIFSYHFVFYFARGLMS